MFSILQAEMGRRKISKTDLANTIGVRLPTITNKMEGKTEWLLKETIAIRNMLNEIKPLNMNIEELFERDEV